MDEATAVFVDVARFYGLAPARMRPDLEIAGSPERCEYRAVIEDERGKLYLVESLFDHTRARKVQIADALAALHREGMDAIHPYLADVRGEQVTRYGDGFWQIMPYIEGVPLPRPGWVHEAWRGLALAEFLLALRQVADRLGVGRGWPAFSLSAYIADMLERMATYHAGLLPDLEPVARFLRPFLEGHDALPVAFCHGDYHPVNVIWGPDGLRAVIDWEFMGPKAELYDAAILVGCAGVEAPEALTGDLVRAFLQHLRGNAAYAEESWRWLLELVLAARFGWLAEWLRKRDEPMIELELDYMHLLMGRATSLRSAWP